MKIKVLKTSLLPLLFITSSLQLATAQQKKLNIQITGSENQLLYASNEIRKAAIENRYIVTGSSFLNKASEDVVVRVLSDSAAAVKVARDENLKMPENLSWQSYAIRVKNNGNQKNIWRRCNMAITNSQKILEQITWRSILKRT